MWLIAVITLTETRPSVTVLFCCGDCRILCELAGLAHFIQPVDSIYLLQVPWYQPYWLPSSPNLIISRMVIALSKQETHCSRWREQSSGLWWDIPNRRSRFISFFSNVILLSSGRFFPCLSRLKRPIKLWSWTWDLVKDNQTIILWFSKTPLKIFGACAGRCMLG